MLTENPHRKKEWVKRKAKEIKKKKGKLTLADKVELILEYLDIDLDNV